MNSREARYQVQPWMRLAATPGVGGLSVDSFVMRGLRPPQWMLEADWSSPSPLTYAEQEGNDTPFHTTFRLGKELPDRLHTKWAADRRSAVQQSVWNLGLPFPIFIAPPEEYVLHPWLRHTDIPQDALEKIRRRRIFSILEMTPSAPGYDPKKTAATTYPLTTCDVLNKVQERLMEFPSSGVSFSSGLWSREEALRYLNERLNHFLERTGLIRTVTYIQVVAGVSSYSLPSDVMEVNRIVFLDGESSPQPLIRADKFQLDNSDPGWQTDTGTPQMVLEEPLEYLEIQLVPIPNINGQLEIIYTGMVSVDNIPCDALPIPATFEPYITWGVIADMLKREGEMHDPERAAYAEGRYEEGIQLALMMRGDG